MDDILTTIGGLAIGGAPLVPVVIALVALAKRLGMPGQYAPWLNGALSTLAFVAVMLLDQYPAYQEIAKTAVVAISIFLVSSGVYQLSKTGPA